MKKPVLLACLTLFALVETLIAQPIPSVTSYALNFDRSLLRPQNDRMLNAVSLDATSIANSQPKRMYCDLTSQLFVVRAGQAVQPMVNFTGAWMHTYIYIDLNQNGQFDVQTPGPQGQLQEDNELVSFSALTLADGNYNSAGESLESMNAVQPPAFTIPETLAPGFYMMRWKIDWDSTDPAGCIVETNSIINNRGAVVDVILRVVDDEEEAAYELVFADEFDLPDGSRPDATYWHSSPRYGSVWDRWVSNSSEVAFIQDGNLVCRAIPNPDTSTDDVPMITGSMETSGRFSFTYGKVAVRLRTLPHDGNFPAAWLMPQPPCETWPNAGEIDIFEAIDAQNTSYHTIHSHWSFDLGHKSDPLSSFTSAVTVAEWHVYGLEWTKDYLIFSVDDKPVALYPRSTDQDVLSQGQWPFEHPFYLILNQSVGNGSWAKAADTSFTYETLFDYVRVYQRPNSDAVHDIAFKKEWTAGKHVWYDLSGRDLGTASPRHSGIYIVNGQKRVVR